MSGQKHNRILIASLVLFMGLIIAAPQAYVYYLYYLKSGEILTAKHTKSVQAQNAKDTVLIPFYTFTREIGPIKQVCDLPLIDYVHALNTQPTHDTLTLKVGEKCTDFVVMNDPPNERLPVLIVGLAILLAGLVLMRKAFKS